MAVPVTLAQQYGSAAAQSMGSHAITVPVTGATSVGSTDASLMVLEFWELPCTSPPNGPSSDWLVPSWEEGFSGSPGAGKAD